MSRTKLQHSIHFICIDQRSRASNGQTYIICNNEQLILPPPVTRVPALYFSDTHKVLFGDDIYKYLLPKEAEITHVATSGQGEPECFSMNQMSQLSDMYSYLDQSAEDMSAKGNGGIRQLRHFSALDENTSIQTPDEDYVPDKVGKNGKTMEEYKNEREQAVAAPIQRR
jgi:hypothetical protein